MSDPHLPDVLRHSLVHLFAAAALKIEAQTRRELELLELSPRLMWALLTLSESGPRSQRQLGDVLGIDRTTMVGVIDALEELGLIARERDPRDRRAWRVVVTERGEAKSAWAKKMMASAEALAIKNLTPAQGETLRKLLLKLVDEDA